MPTKRVKKLYVLLSIALLFVISAGASLSLLNKSQGLLSLNEKSSGRAIVQLVILQQSYINMLMQLGRGDPMHEELLVAYDLTWSAYDVLLRGSKNAYFISDGQRIIKLKHYFEKFKESDPMVKELSGQKLTIALHNAQQAHSYAVELLNYEFQGFAQQTHVRDFELVRLNKIMIIGLLGLTFSGGLFLFIIVRERRYMHYLAYHDSLTQIANRSALQNKITLLQSNHTPFCALLIDVDRFKFINDNFSHDVGDKLLIKLTQKMCEILGGGNIIGRLGGDEFAIIYLGKSSVELVALKLLEITNGGIHIDGYDCDIALSIGISYSQTKHNDWIDVLKEADNAMYQAKAKGGNQYQFYDAKTIIN